MCRYPNGEHPEDCQYRVRHTVIRLWGRQYLLLRKSTEPGYFTIRQAIEWDGLCD